MTPQEALEYQAKINPNGTAVATEKESYTYTQLFNDVVQLASRLNKSFEHLSENAVIGIYLPRSYGLIVARFALMFTPWAALVLQEDGQNPEELLTFIFNAANAQALISLSDKHPFTSDSEIMLFTTQPPATETVKANLKIKSAAAPNYIAASSGSSGKGVKIMSVSGKGIPAACDAHIKILKKNMVRACIALFSDAGFDAFQIEAWLIAYGIKSCLIPSQLRNDLDSKKLGSFFTQHGVTAAIFTPLMLNILDPKDFPSLKTLFIVGDQITEEHLKRFYDAEINLILGYGLTESTVALSLSLYTPERRINIGKAIPGSSMLIIDADGNPITEPNHPGQLVFWGESLFLGYIIEGKTHRKLIEVNVESTPTLAFPTGDKCMLDEYGNFVCLGRIERDQVKIFGQMVNLCGLRTTLIKQPPIQDAIITTDRYRSGQVYLNAYIKMSQDFPFDLISFYEMLREKIPLFMIPTQYALVKEIPTNTSGKVNLAQLEKNNPLSRLIDTKGEEVQNAIERVVADIFKTILEIPDDIHLHSTDDFFILGGRSLNGFSLINAINTYYNIILEPKDLEEATSIGNIAHIIENRINPVGCIEELNPRNRPQYPIHVIFIHSITGNLQGYETLKSSFQKLFYLYGISCDTTDPGKLGDTLDDMAKTYAYNIAQEIKEKDEIIICVGWSSGGALATLVIKYLELLGYRYFLAVNVDGNSPQYLQQLSNEEHADQLQDLLEQLAVIAPDKTPNMKGLEIEKLSARMQVELAFQEYLLSIVKQILLATLNTDHFQADSETTRIFSTSEEKRSEKLSNMWEITPSMIPATTHHSILRSNEFIEALKSTIFVFHSNIALNSVVTHLREQLHSNTLIENSELLFALNEYRIIALQTCFANNTLLSETLNQQWLDRSLKNIDFVLTINAKEIHYNDALSAGSLIRAALNHQLNQGFSEFDAAAIEKNLLLLGPRLLIVVENTQGALNARLIEMLEHIIARAKCSIIMSGDQRAFNFMQKHAGRIIQLDIPDQSNIYHTLCKLTENLENKEVDSTLDFLAKVASVTHAGQSFTKKFLASIFISHDISAELNLALNRNLIKVIIAPSFLNRPAEVHYEFTSTHIWNALVKRRTDKKATANKTLPSKS
jgi:acyl-coenzyme A synthetase/AMP-(fatty) acid ligase/thioesterase domain-containing protein/acyl carrier protein